MAKKRGVFLIRRTAAMSEIFSHLSGQMSSPFTQATHYSCPLSRRGGRGRRNCAVPDEGGEWIQWTAEVHVEPGKVFFFFFFFLIRTLAQLCQKAKSSSLGDVHGVCSFLSFLQALGGLTSNSRKRICLRGRNSGRLCGT